MEEARACLAHAVVAQLRLPTAPFQLYLVAFRLMDGDASLKPDDAGELASLWHAEGLACVCPQGKAR